jgi:hypothetical protein
VEYEYVAHMRDEKCLQKFSGEGEGKGFLRALDQCNLGYWSMM